MRSSNRQVNHPPESIRRDLLERGSRMMLFLSGGSFFMALIITLWTILAPGQPASAYQTANMSRSTTLGGDDQLNAGKPLIGIVVGHAGYDPGAVCDDGLTEAEINLHVSEEVASLLNRRGIRTNLLEEFDPRLTGYTADALVSIHADSCNVPGASGFKVARVTESAIPEDEDRLVNCLIQEYGRITHLPEHPASITDGMTNYHAFREIAPITPGAIIEIGFMLDDRYLLEKNPKLLARGVASGVICFLESDNERE